MKQAEKQKRGLFVFVEACKYDGFEHVNDVEALGQFVTVC